MSDRKYRQHGYQDDDRRDRSAQAPRPKEPRDPRLPRDPKVPNMPGFREVFRCARCGNIEGTDVGSLSVCRRCGVVLRACIQCASFDSGARFECRQTLTARVSPKDAANDCRFYSPRVSVERETGSTPQSSTASTVKRAFDDLFKF
jgi:hypothetical protein